VVIVTPGQDTLLTVRNTVVGGRGGGFATAVGVVIGQLCWALALSVGVAAVLVAAPSAILVLTLGGAAYLVYLGVQYLRDASRESMPALPVADRASPAPNATFLRQGLISNLGNPKMLLFFTSLLPPFAAQMPGVPVVALGLAFSLLTLAWLSCYVGAVSMLGSFLARTAVRRGVNLVAGTALIVVGLGVAAAATQR
jgi:threonine/homoserine/homoserine lactone efflux protein